MNNYHVKCPHCQIGVIVTERSKLLDELADCLRELHELQNGAPLIKYEKEWTACMERTIELLKRIG